MRVVRLRLGDERIELPSTSRRAGRPIPVDSRSNDRWFQHVAIIVSRHGARLRAAARSTSVEHASPDRSGCRTGTRTPAASRPSTSRIPTATRSRSCSSRRQGRRASGTRRRDRLFLGIDHTAIVVADTEASLRFYRDALGPAVAGESENYGPEQEHLNNVFGARLRITALRARARPGHRVAGIPGARATAGRLRRTCSANDLVHWQTTVATSGIDARLRGCCRDVRLRLARRGRLLADGRLGSGAVLVRDPDGQPCDLAKSWLSSVPGESRSGTTYEVRAAMTAEATAPRRNREQRTAHWKRWGPYLSERAWGTVREDYSADGNAWDYFPHDHARSRAYRWNEDGLAGICDRHQTICFALALWNGRDPILKERLFGLTGNEGNHGEDVKEYYFYLDSTPTHSYMKYLYKYPQRAFPYAELVEENRRRGKTRAGVRAARHRRLRRATATSTSSSSTPRRRPRTS